MDQIPSCSGQAGSAQTGTNDRLCLKGEALMRKHRHLMSSNGSTRVDAEVTDQVHIRSREIRAKIVVQDVRPRHDFRLWCKNNSTLGGPPGDSVELSHDCLGPPKPKEMA